MGHAPLTELRLRHSGAWVLIPSPGLFLVPAAPQSGNREPQINSHGACLRKARSPPLLQAGGEGLRNAGSGCLCAPDPQTSCEVHTASLSFTAVKWHSHGLSSGSDNWTTGEASPRASWHRTNGSKKHTAPTHLTIVTNSWPCEGSTGTGAGRWRGLEPRPPGEPLDSGTSVPQSEQCWRTSPYWAPDQRQKCVALTLSSDLKQAGREVGGTWS